MKKVLAVISLLAVIGIAGYMSACGGGQKTVVVQQPQPKQQEEPRATKVFVLRRSIEPAPEWVMNAGNYMVKTVEEDGKKKKVIYVVYEREGKNKNFAIKAVQGEILSIFARAIKSLTTAEFAMVQEGTEEAFDTYIQEAVANVAKAVQTGGIVPAGIYWEEIEEVSPDGKRERKYRVVARYAMNYEDFVRNRDEAWNNVKKKANLPPDKKKKMDDMLKALHEKADQQDQLSGPIGE